MTSRYELNTAQWHQMESILLEILDCRAMRRDNRRFVKIARGSLYETRHWLRRAYQRQLLTDEQIEQFRTLLNELSPRLNAYLNAIGPKNP